MSKPKTRRLPDTYNSEVTRAKRPKGALGNVSTVQFQFALGAEQPEESRKNAARVEDPQR